MHEELDDRLQKRVYDGNRAREVLENEAFEGAFTSIEQELVEAWKTSPARDEAGRQKIWEYLTLLKKVKTHLQSTLQDGKVAELDLNHRRTLVERARDGWNSFTG